MTSKVAKVQISDEVISQQVEPLVDNLNELSDNPILRGRLLEDVDLTRHATNKIRHGLNRKLRGWIVVRHGISDTLGVIYDEQDSNKHTDQELWLRYSGTPGAVISTVSLWVF